MTSLPVLVLLPGMEGTGRLFDRLRAALEPSVESVVVRYPTDLALGYRELTEVVRAALPQGRPYVLLGESFSGPIAITLASEGAAELRGVILSCAFARSPLPWAACALPLIDALPVHAVPLPLVNWVLLGRHATPNLRADIGAVYRQVSAAAWRARLRAVLTVDVTAALCRISVPLLYLRAGKDRLVPRAAWRLIQSHIPQAKLQELAAPHCLLQVAAAAGADHITAFLRSSAQ